MIHAVVLWFGMGLLSLIMMTVSDYTRKMLIDQRRNMIMFGASIMLIAYVEVGLWYLLSCVVVTVLLTVFLSRIKAVGGSDISTIAWIFYGLSLISYSRLFLFFCFFAVFTSIYHAIIFFVLKTRRPFPFYPVILGSYVIVLFSLL